MENNLSETAWQRAKRDTEHFRTSAKSYWLIEVIGAAIFGALGAYGGFKLIAENSSPLQQFLFPTIGGSAGIVSGFGVAFALILLWNLFGAPYRQRDESRTALRKQKMTLEQLGWIEAFMFDATELRNHLNDWKDTMRVLDETDRSVFREWYESASQYLQKNMPTEYQDWYHNVDIINNDSPLLEEALKAYEAGYNILRDIQKRLNQSLLGKEGSQT